MGWGGRGVVSKLGRRSQRGWFDGGVFSIGLVGYGGLEDASDDATVAEAMRTEVRRREHEVWRCGGVEERR